LAKRLACYGCTDFIRLDEKLSTPAQLDYLDLLPTRSNHPPTVTAVAEHQGTAILYIVDACGNAKVDDDSRVALQRDLANRSDPAWLGVVKSGSLEVFPIGFHERADAQPVKVIQQRNTTAPFFFQSLVHGTFEGNSKLRGTDYVYEKIFNLLTQTTDRFVPLGGKRHVDAIVVLSMAGRALFFRFLIDRGIVLPAELSGPDGICPAASELKDAFSTAEKAAQTSAWLDTTFNGDFLPLIDESISIHDRAGRETAYLEFYRRVQHLVGKSIFNHLHAILRGWRPVGGDFQTEIDWGDLDFKHIPVGVLSQVYESFSHRADPRTARDTSIHYTPRTVAKLMVDQAFAGVKDPGSAMVLDSACGAGIFLVLALRRLVRERWQEGERPNTAAIQDVLYNQIRGFEISESALRLAALALYITAIELNASPRPPRELKFPRNLRGEVLFGFGNQGATEERSALFPIGSLGPDVSPSKFDGKFDIVIGNPPWTRLRNREEGEDEDKRESKSAIAAVNSQFTAIGRRVLKSRGHGELAKNYDNPDNNPDIPFLWRAMEWAKPGGVIALVMPARLFGRTTGKGYGAWRAVLRSVAVTGLVNGADLRKTRVWEGVDMPFCMLFARNGLPKPDYRFYYAAPSYEPSLNGDGRFRIDYEAATPVSAARIEEQPWLLKTLSLGTWLDVELMEKLLALPFKPLGDFWRAWDESGDKTGKGYDRSPALGQKPAEFLADLPDFRPIGGAFTVQFDELITYFQRYRKRTAYWPKTERLYQPPLVVIRQSPGKDRRSPRAFLASRPLGFSQSYYGYSCAGHPEAPTLAALIYLLPHTALFEYFCLMTSRRSGFDRQTFNKEEFDALPFPDIAVLDARTKSMIRSLAERLQNSVRKPWQEINEFIFGLYELDPHDVQVAEDTLFAATSYRKAGRAALDCTTRDTRADFIATLSKSLEPYFDLCGEHVAVREAEFQPDAWREPWFFLSLSRQAEAVNVNPNLLQKVMQAANRSGCSRIIVEAPKKSGLLLGLLNQQRWWTITRAGLCAQHIIRERLGAFGLPEDV
jgi:hypothetical protein